VYVAAWKRDASAVLYF